MLSDDELTSLTDDIANIMNYVEALEQLDTTGVEPTYQVTGLQNVMRDDVIHDSSVSRDELLALAPQRSETSIKVPKVL